VSFLRIFCLDVKIQDCSARELELNLPVTTLWEFLRELMSNKIIEIQGARPSRWHMPWNRERMLQIVEKISDASVGVIPTFMRLRFLIG
jgi:hypothetical protein